MGEKEGWQVSTEGEIQVARMRSPRLCQSLVSSLYGVSLAFSSATKGKGHEEERDQENENEKGREREKKEGGGCFGHLGIWSN